MRMKRSICRISRDKFSICYGKRKIRLWRRSTDYGWFDMIEDLDWGWADSVRFKFCSANLKFSLCSQLFNDPKQTLRFDTRELFAKMRDVDEDAADLFLEGAVLQERDTVSFPSSSSVRSDPLLSRGRDFTGREVTCRSSQAISRKIGRTSRRFRCEVSYSRARWSTLLILCALVLADIHRYLQKTLLHNSKPRPRLLRLSSLSSHLATHPILNSLYSIESDSRLSCSYRARQSMTSRMRRGNWRRWKCEVWDWRWSEWSFMGRWAESSLDHFRSGTDGIEVLPTAQARSSSTLPPPEQPPRPLVSRNLFSTIRWSAPSLRHDSYRRSTTTALQAE